MTVIEETLVWFPSARLDVAEVETWLEAAAGAIATEIRLGTLRRVSPRAESLLQGAILRLRRSGTVVWFSVPPLTFNAGRTARETVDDRNAPMTATEGLLAGSVAGLTIALLCEPHGEDAGRAVQHVLDRLRVRRGHWGRGFQTSRIETQNIPGIRSSTWATSRVTSRDGIRSQLDDMARSLIGSGSANRMGERISRWAVDFSFEAMQNARTHGRVGFRGESLASLRTFTLRRHNLTNRPIAETFGRPEGPFEQYASRVSRRHPRRMLELVVGDGGVGIAARMHRSSEIYTAFEGAEAQLVQEAMWPGWTTDRLRSLESGEGFRIILRACARLNGYFELRTGRQEFSRHYLNVDGGPSTSDFGDDSPLNPAYALTRNRSRPYVAGTSLTLIFPVEEN